MLIARYAAEECANATCGGESNVIGMLIVIGLAFMWAVSRGGND